MNNYLKDLFIEYLLSLGGIFSKISEVSFGSLRRNAIIKAENDKQKCNTYKI